METPPRPQTLFLVGPPEVWSVPDLDPPTAGGLAAETEKHQIKQKNGVNGGFEENISTFDFHFK